MRRCRARVRRVHGRWIGGRMGWDWRVGVGVGWSPVRSLVEAWPLGGWVQSRPRWREGAELGRDGGSLLVVPARCRAP